MKRFPDKNQSFIRFFWPTLLLVVLLLLLFPSIIAQGQESPITAMVNYSEYTTDDLIILTVTVVDDSAQQPRPILPSLDGLAVIEFDIATNMSMVNGNIQTEVVYTYQLQPRRTGRLTIPPVTVKIDGEVFKAAPITITVNQGTAPAPSQGNAGMPPSNLVPPPELENQDFFVESAIDVSTPYLGQQVIYTFRFYQAIKLYQAPQYEMPLFNGFDTVGLPVQEYNLDIGGRTYLISEVRLALFPKTSGNVTIGPARLMIPGNYFEEPIELYTGPAALQVKSLPNNAPPGFSGAVGQYQIEAWFSPQVAVVNQPATFSVAVSGNGNIHTLPEPIWPNLNSWRAYDSQGKVTAALKNGQVSGTRIYERVIVSDKVGDFIIPPAKFVYFDPIAGEYRTVSSRSLSGRIIPAPTPDPAAATAQAVLPTATPGSSFNRFGTPVPIGSRDVIRISPDSLESAWGLILPMGIVLFWAVCGAVPVALAIGAGGFWLWQKRQQDVEVKTQTLQHPRQKMHPMLAQALATSDDNNKAVSRAIYAYLSQVLDTLANGLTHTELANRLQARGLSKLLIDRVKECLIQSEMGRYGPKTDDAGWDLVAKTDELLLEIDESLGNSADKL